MYATISKVAFLCLMLVAQMGFSQKTADDYFKEGKAHFDGKNFENALESFDEAIKLRGNFASAYLYRGTAAFYTGNPVGAAINWSKAKSYGIADAQKLLDSYINPEIYQASKPAEEYHEEGQEKFKKGDFYGSIIDYSNALYLNQTLGWTFNKRAYAKMQIAANLTDQQKIAWIKSAISDYNMAIEVRPTDAKLYTFRGIARCLAGDKTAGCEDIQAGIAKGHTQSAENKIPEKYCK